MNQNIINKKLMKVTNKKKAKKLTELEQLLEKHSDKFQQLQNGKIKCLITGHEFLPSEQNLNSHLNSKSYKKAIESKYDISEYEDVLKTHKQDNNFLFCRLTGAKVPKKKTAIQKHVNGKRFKARFQQYKAQIEQQQEEQLDEEQDQEEVDGQVDEDSLEEQENQGQDQQQEEQEDQSEQQKLQLKKGSQTKKSSPNGKSKNKKIQKQANGHGKPKRR